MIEQKPVEHYLKAWREHRGMTQHQLAGPAGTTKHTVSRIEHGRTGLDDDMLRAFGRVLNCRPGDILNSAPDDASEIQPLWDRLDNASKDLFRQLVELKVSALEKPTRVDPDSMQRRFDRLGNAAQDRVRHMIDLELGAAKSVPRK